MNTALILSGGTGSRMGADIPKQYIKVHGKPIIQYCLETIARHEMIDAIQIAADGIWQEFILKCMEEAQILHKFKGFSAPGENRQLSIWNGLEAIRKYASEQDLIFIHDGARPLLSSELIRQCLEAAAGYDGVLPVLPMKDTVYLSEDGEKITSLLNRSQIFAGQAPEVFTLGAYYRANKALFPEKILKINGSTEPAVMAGMKIRMIPGDEKNFKITTREDLKRFEETVGKAREF